MVTNEFIKEYESFLVSTYRQKDMKLTTEDIQDLVQDTFEKVTLYQDYYIHDYDPDKRIPEDRRLASWLKLVCVQVYDRHKRASLQIDEIAKDFSEGDLLESTNDYYYASNKEEIDQLVDLLPRQQRLAVYNKLILGYTHEEVASKLNVSLTNSSTLYRRGIENLKKLINSDDPINEVLYEPRILKPYGDKAFEGDWSWRYGESPDRRSTKWYQYSKQEIIDYCLEHNLNYNLT